MANLRKKDLFLVLFQKKSLILTPYNPNFLIKKLRLLGTKSANYRQDYSKPKILYFALQEITICLID